MIRKSAILTFIAVAFSAVQAGAITLSGLLTITGVQNPDPRLDIQAGDTVAVSAVRPAVDTQQILSGGVEYAPGQYELPTGATSFDLTHTRGAASVEQYSSATDPFASSNYAGLFGIVSTVPTAQMFAAGLPGSYAGQQVDILTFGQEYFGATAPRFLEIDFIAPQNWLASHGPVTISDLLGLPAIGRYTVYGADFDASGNQLGPFYSATAYGQFTLAGSGPGTGPVTTVPLPLPGLMLGLGLCALGLSARGRRTA